MNRQAKQIISRALIVGGLATSAGSIYDHSQNKSLLDEHETRQKLTDEFREDRKIDEVCTAGVFSQMPVCYDVIEGKEADEEKRLLSEYRTELEEKLNKVPSDPEAHSRGVRDSAGMLGGAIVAAAGLYMRSKER